MHNPYSKNTLTRIPGPDPNLDPHHHPLRERTKNSLLLATLVPVILSQG